MVTSIELVLEYVKDGDVTVGGVGVTDDLIFFKTYFMTSRLFGLYQETVDVIQGQMMCGKGLTIPFALSKANTISVMPIP